MRFFFTLCFIYSFMQLTYSQSNFSPDIRAVYQMQYQPDSNNVEKKEELMELFIDAQKSIFRSVNYGRIDSAMIAEKKKGNSFGPSLAFGFANLPLIKYTLIKDRDNITSYDQISSDPKDARYYIEELPLYNWQISNDTLWISNILCQKATTNFGGRNWIAWFAPKIPLPYGPYKFFGLPGLILKIADIKNYWVFTLISLEKTNSSFEYGWNFNASHKSKSKQDFFVARRYYVDNMALIQEAAGRWKYDNAEQRKQTIIRTGEKAKKDNNWIELYKP